MPMPDCTNDPKGCQDLLRASSDDQGRNNAVVVVATVSILGVVAIAGMVLYAYLWKNKQGKRKKGSRRSRDRSTVNKSFIAADTTVQILDGQDDAFAVRSNANSTTIKKTLDTAGKQKSQVQERSMMSASLAKVDGDGNDNDEKPLVGSGAQPAVWDNEQAKYEDEGRNAKGVTGTIQVLTDETTEKNKERVRGRGRIEFQYRHLGAASEIDNVHPKCADDRNKSNQSLFDIVLVRMSLVNEDFVHRSRYTSGSPFGFRHDVIAYDEEDVNANVGGAGDDEDNYSKRQTTREGSAF